MTLESVSRIYVIDENTTKFINEIFQSEMKLSARDIYQNNEEFIFE